MSTLLKLRATGIVLVLAALALPGTVVASNAMMESTLLAPDERPGSPDPTAAGLPEPGVDFEGTEDWHSGCTPSCIQIENCMSRPQPSGCTVVKVGTDERDVFPGEEHAHMDAAFCGPRGCVTVYVVVWLPDTDQGDNLVVSIPDAGRAEKVLQLA